MIYITGDTHGDYTRFTTENFPEQREMTKEDKVIICGDFGFWLPSKEQDYWLNWLEEKPFTTLFVDGNHENHALLNALPMEEQFGGKVHKIRPSVIHLMRGEVYEIEGKRLFTFGGAASHDIQDGILDPEDPDFKKKKARFDRQGKRHYRILNRSWWKEELPTDEEVAHGIESLEKVNWEVDYIFSHCAPYWIVKQLLPQEDCQPDVLTSFLEKLSMDCRFQYWFFGHYHQNRVLGDKYVCLYEQIIPLWDKKGE